ncbi:hypothetical protein CSB37_02180 [bacterium DOLZORAL124_38_8]|nr:MAG: hypothetical protein CSB37_02180 [bacterium DOLZORAL124_38_8]
MKKGVLFGLGLALLATVSVEAAGEIAVNVGSAVDNSLIERTLKLPWPVMSFILGLIDGFNPCAMWTLLILIGFLLGMNDRKKRWFIGGIFIASSAVLYFGALLAYLLGFEAIAAYASGTVMLWVFRVVGLVALVSGMKTLWDGIRNKNECSVKDIHERRNFKTKLEQILARDQFWLVLVGVIGLAFAVNVVELLCSFAIPTLFTNTLVNVLDLSFMNQLLGIFIYDVAYIFDDILVFSLAMFAVSSVQLTSGKFVRASNLIGGLLLLVLGGLMIFNPALLGQLAG